MTSFVLRRLGTGIVLVVVVTALTALFIYSSGTDIARNILGNTASEAQVRQRAAELGLNRPPVQQYFDWLVGAVQGNLGKSYFNSEPVLSSLTNRFPVPLSMVVGAVLLTAILSAPLGVLSAIRRGWIDRLVQVFNVV